MKLPSLKLRTKTTLVTVAVLAVASLLIHFGVTRVASEQVAEIEMLEAQHNVHVVRDAMASALTELGATAEAWGGWDDTYRMATDPAFRPAYIKAAGGAEILGPTGISLMAFFDLQGNLLHGVAADLNQDGVETPLPTDFAAVLKATPGLLEGTDTTRRERGIVMFAEGPMLVAVQPITSNDFSADPVGRVVIGRYLDQREIEALRQKTRLDLALLPVNDDEVPEEITSVDSAWESAYSGIHADLDDETCVTYAAIDDYSGDPVLAMRILAPRTAQALLRNTSSYLLLALGILSGLAGLASHYLLNRLVHVKVDRLVSAVRGIGKRDAHDPRIDMPGNDEFTELGGAIDEMVVRMQEANRQLAATTESLREREGELEETVASLAEANTAKDRFLANMSHELRTPLNSIIGFSHMLERGMPGELNEEQLRQVEMIHNSGQHLLSLIDDILDLAKIQADKIRLNIEAVSVSALLLELEHTSATLIAASSVALVVTPPVPDVEISTDRRRLLQILLNLTSNAAKFTPEGQIAIDARRAGDSVVISVTDSGVGIAAENLSVIMEEFTQVGSQEDGRPPGTGLGLAISSRFAYMLGGGITVQSEPGKGSTFTVTLPITGPTAKALTD